jgi:hypothetical protein
MDFSPHILEVCERIRALVNPHRIILFGHKPICPARQVPLSFA